MFKFIKTYLKIFVFGFVIATTLGYSYYQTQDFVRGPQLEVSSPSNGSIHKNSIVIVKGNAQNISYISLNDRQIFTDQKGDFSEKILLAKGYNAIKVATQDKYMREKQTTLELVYLPQKNTLSINNN